MSSSSVCIALIVAGLHGRGVDGLLPKRAPLPALYWGTDKVGGPESKSVTTGKPISSLFTSRKAYLSCLNPSGLPCLASQVLRSFWIRSSGASSRRSSGGRVGRQLGRLGPQTGRRVFWYAGPTCRGRP
jgi:hypothetical protein